MTDREEHLQQLQQQVQNKAEVLSKLGLGLINPMTLVQLRLEFYIAAFADALDALDIDGGAWLVESEIEWNESMLELLNQAADQSQEGESTIVTDNQS